MDTQMTKIRMMAAAADFTAALWDDGTVSVAGKGVRTGRVQTRKIQRWQNIARIAAGENSGVAALTQQGEVLLEGLPAYDKWRKAAAAWKNIVFIALGSHCLAAVDAQGQVFAVGDEDMPAVTGWTGMAKIALYGSFAVGVKLDGAVVCTEYNARNDWLDAVSQWTQVADVTVGMQDSVAGNALYVAGLCRDGGVLCAAKYPVFEREVAAWQNVTALYGAMRDVIFAVDRNGNLLCNGSKTVDDIEPLSGITAFAAAEGFAVALTGDGQLHVLGEPGCAPQTAQRPSQAQALAQEAARREKQGKIASLSVLGVGVVLIALLWLTGLLRSYEVTTPSGAHIASAPVFFTILIAFVCLAVVCFLWPEGKKQK